MTPTDSKGVLLAIDQGTTGTKALILDSALRVVAEASREFPQHFPRPGEVEHEPAEIFASVRDSVRAALEASSCGPETIVAIGITNQRETTLLWDAETSAPVHRAIVWQDRRTADMCQDLKARGLETMFRERTGLLLDPYFSGTKIAWILDKVKGARAAAEGGKLRFGTVDTYLAWRLSAGEEHVTDASNASRTLLMNLETCEWDADLLDALGVPAAVLPRIVDNDSVFARTRGLDFLPDGIPITTMIGDQQSALFGQACFSPGEGKCTYGTGAFLVLHTGDRIILSKRGLLATAAWRIGGETTYALEGSSFVAGAIVQWLRDGLGIIQSSDEIEALARSVPDAQGVVLVPSLTGLGAPHWDPRAQGLICGLTRGTTRAHLARAALDGIAFQIRDLVDAMERDTGTPARELKVDGGASRNDLLMQFQADVLGCEVVRPAETSTTALGAALLAGLSCGFFPSLDAIRKSWKEAVRFKPRMKKREVAEHVERWERAIRRVRL